MGFFKKLFGGNEEISEEIRAARERHGIEVEEPSAAGGRRKDRWEKREAEPYDPWEEIRNIRYQFFFGALGRRRPTPKTNHEAIIKDLEEATRKREERYQQKQAEKRRKEEEKARRKGGA